MNKLEQITLKQLQKVLADLYNRCTKFDQEHPQLNHTGTLKANCSEAIEIVAALIDNQDEK